VLGYLPTNFGLPSAFGSRVIHYVRDRQTDRRTDGRTKATLNAPYPTGGGITTWIIILLYMTNSSRHSTLLSAQSSLRVIGASKRQAFPSPGLFVRLPIRGPVIDWRMVVVVGGNVLHHVKREVELSGWRNVRGNMSEGGMSYIRATQTQNEYFE